MRRMKTSWIVMANVALVAVILVFVALYSNREQKENYEHQVEHFVNTTVAMERVTGNYLEGYSTRPRPNTADDYAVSYARMDLIGDGSWIADLDAAITGMMKFET